MKVRHCPAILVLLILLLFEIPIFASDIRITRNLIPDSLKIEKQYYHLYSWLYIADKRKDDFYNLDIQHEPVNLPPGMPNPFSNPNRYLITMPLRGSAFIILKSSEGKIKSVYDMGTLNEGATIYFSTDEHFRDRIERFGGSHTLYVIIDKKIYLKLDLFLIGKNSRESLQDNSGIYYPDCTIFEISDTENITFPTTDWVFWIADDSTLASLELLDSQKKSIRVFFRTYFNKGNYGLIFRKIDGKGNHLEISEYYFLLKVGEKENLVKFDLVK